MYVRACYAAVSDAWSESCVVAATSPDMVGYLSNRLRRGRGGGGQAGAGQRCGTESRPWIVSVLPGQRINVTLLDFTASRGRHLPPTHRKARSTSTRNISPVFQHLPEPNRACLVGVYAFLIWNNLCDLVYQSQIPVAFGIPGHVTTKRLPDTPC